MRIIFQKEIDAKSISVSPKPVWKCMTCPNYGKSPSCPPNAPSWKSFKELLEHYDKALIFKFAVEGEFEIEKRKIQEFLLEKERELVKSGYTFAIAFFPGNCNLCTDCENPCRKPEKRRFSISGVGVELAKLIEVDPKESSLYALILLE